MKRSLVATLLVGAVGCTDSNAPKVPPPPPPPPPPMSFGIRPALDTVPLGSYVEFFAATPDSTVDRWVMSDTSIARFGPPVRSYVWVVARAPGTVTITARHGADSGLATLVIQAPAPAPAGWDVIDLGIMDAMSGRPVAINDNGTIVGALRYNPYASDGREERGFVYNFGMMRYLAGPDSLPLAIGPSDAIVGKTELTGLVGQFVIWELGAGPRPLPNGTYDPQYGAQVVGLNARGDILASIGLDGLSQYRTGRLWRNNSPVDVGQLNASIPMRTLATAWNARGQIVGFSPVSVFYDAGDSYYQYHPFVWENGVMRDLGLLGHITCDLTTPLSDCSWGTATAINTNGTVVGMTTGADSTLVRAFIWQDGEMRDLGVFPGHFTTASAINDRGQVLGSIGYPYSRDTTFLWENGGAQILPFSGSILGPNGEVVGTRDGHVFIWDAGQVTDLGVGSPIAMNERGEIIGTRGALPTLWRKKRG